MTKRGLLLFVLVAAASCAFDPLDYCPEGTEGVADCTGKDFSGWSMETADLKGVDFTRSNLSNANLSNADLSNADLSSANLSAGLTGVNLSHANLTGANLSRADLVRTVLNGATASPHTRWPDGVDPAVAGVIFKD